MARVIDYDSVLRQADTLGLTCVYYNTGALGFPDGERPAVVGWLGPDDPTIRPGVAGGLVRVPPPWPRSLAEAFARFWPGDIDGEAWLLPKSHWAFELGHGHGEWLAPALAAAGIDAETLRPRADGSAIAFDAGDPACIGLIETLLANLRLSDFAVMFRRHRHLVTIHHHQQIWWQTTDAAMATRLSLAAGRAGAGADDDFR